MTQFDNPITGYRDVYRWPYSWSQDWASSVNAWLYFFNEDGPFIDPWTYENHVRVVPCPGYESEKYTIDAFDINPLAFGPRQQLPPNQCHDLLAFVVEVFPYLFDCVITQGVIWRPNQDTQTYTGPDGDRVDCVHLEFNPQAISDWAGQPLEPIQKGV